MATASVKWLSKVEQRTWRAFLEADRLLMDCLDRELQRDAGMSIADYEILVRLSEAPRRQMRMSELADKTLLSRSRLSHAVGRLESAGWVDRRGCPTDKRGTLAVLTDTGYGVLEKSAPGHVAAVRHYVFDALSPGQVSELLDVATAIRARLDGPH